MSYDEPNISDDMYKLAMKLVILMKRFDEDSKDELAGVLPTVLVFLPGINEILKMESILVEHMKKT